MEMLFKHRITKEITENIEPIKIIAHTKWLGIFQADGSCIELKAVNFSDQTRIIIENGKIRTEGDFKVIHRTDTPEQTTDI
ncbi:MAG: hypothetical protein WAO52_06695 [Prolixibacteraceae bacterium]